MILNSLFLVSRVPVSSVRVFLARSTRVSLSRVTHACNFVKTPKPYARVRVCVCVYVDVYACVNIKRIERVREIDSETGKMTTAEAYAGKLRISYYVYI